MAKKLATAVATSDSPITSASDMVNTKTTTTAVSTSKTVGKAEVQVKTNGNHAPKKMSFQNYKALVLAAMFVSEANQEQTEGDEKAIATEFLNLPNETTKRAIASLESEGLAENGKLTKKGRATATSRNNWVIENKFSINFYEFLKNTRLNYQIATLMIIALGSEENATEPVQGVFNKLRSLMANDEFKVEDKLKNSFYELWCQLTHLLDDMQDDALSADMDSFFNKAEE